MVVLAKALYDYSGATDEELDFTKGTVFDVLNEENDEWWYVRLDDDPSVEGYVPSTYVRRISARDDDVESDREEREHEDERHADTDAQQRRRRSLHIDVGRRQSSMDSRSRIGGSSPRSALRSPSTLYRRKFEKQLPSSSSDARISTLAKALDDGVGHIAKTLAPQMNASGTGYNDLMMDCIDNKWQVRKRTVQCTIGFSLLDAKNVMEDHPSGVIIGRQVRLALFDRQRILSNIHSVSAIAVPDSESTWKFSYKASLLFPKDDENTCFLRTNHMDIKLCLLFELCALVDGGDASGIRDMSAGWGVLPLFTSSGGPIENKTHEIRIYGGSPFENDVDEISNEQKGFLQNMMRPSKQHPRISIRVWKLGRSVLGEINKLPDNMISFLSSVPVFSMYRHVLGEVRFKERRHGTVYDPVLALLPAIASENDLLRLLTATWERKLKSGRAKASNLRTLFTECLLIIWPILHIHEFPPHIPGHDALHRLRRSYMSHFHENGILETIGKNPHQYSFQPFDARELCCS